MSPLKFEVFPIFPMVLGRSTTHEATHIPSLLY